MTLKTKPTMKLLADNRNTMQAMSKDMIVDEKSIQEILEEVTNGDKWKDKRASKLNLDDFLELLSEFNERGIHFA